MEKQAVKESLNENLFEYTTARKSHKCAICGSEIKVKERYIKSPLVHCLACRDESLKDPRLTPFLVDDRVVQDLAYRRSFQVVQKDVLVSMYHRAAFKPAKSA